jgi:hypothetical protein
MKAFMATTTIAATPETIWALLTNGAGYSEWDPGTDRIEGRIAPGEKLKAFTKLSPEKAFPVKVTEFVPGRKMVWTGGIPVLFVGERTYTLEPRGDGTTTFTMREAFSGPLLPLFGRTVPDLTPSFEQFAAGLKSRAEGNN